MKADITKLTYNISRDEFKDLVRNTLLIKEIIDNGGKIINLGKLLESTKYGYTASALKSGNVKLIRITDLKNNYINIETVPFCNCAKYEDYLVKKSDILIGRTGTVGKSFLLDYDLEYKSIYASYLIRLRADKTKVLPEYVYLFLNSYYFWNQLHEIKAGAVKMNINANKIKELEIPYCSIEEQKKILQKIKELTPILENTLEKIGNIYLVDDGTNKNISYIKQLKQAILQDAIEGKLTKTWRENNPNIESASVLLEKIQKEKEELVKQKKLKKQEKLKEISEDEIPFEIPENWSWCRLGEIIHLTSGNFLSSSQMNKNGNIPVFGGNGINGYHNEYNTEEETIVIGRVGFYCGSIHLTPEKAWITDNAFFTIFNSNYIYRNFLIRLLKGTNLKEKENAGAQPVISGTKVYPIPIPLPPLEEQKEIVKNVDEMMMLCDELEKQSLETKENSENLMKSVLSEVFSR